MILVVEDNATLRRTLGRMLTMLGRETTLAANPDEALPLLESGFRPRLIITDMEMPGMHGDQFCALVREKYPEIRVVLISGHPEVHHRGAAAGAHYTIAKPFTKSTIERLIR